MVVFGIPLFDSAFLVGEIRQWNIQEDCAKTIAFANLISARIYMQDFRRSGLGVLNSAIVEMLLIPARRDPPGQLPFHRSGRRCPGAAAANPAI